MWSTPNKGQFKCTSAMLSSPSAHKTPIKQNQFRCKQKGSCFSLLPSHITPPSGITKFIARNPFDAELTNRLHLSMMSPTVFSKVSPSIQDSPGFAWSVDEIALIKPAKIEEFPIQNTHAIDPEIEIKAQAAIDRFFCENQVIPSPCEITKKDKVQPVIGTPTRPLEELNSTKDTIKPKKDNWTQTVLSLPAELPPNVEEVLKPYFTFTQDQNIENDDVNSSTSSLRRKLFFNHDDYSDNDEASSIPLSPQQLIGELVMPSSPPHSGIFLHGTPFKRSSGPALFNHGTPMKNTENLSSPNMSPISGTHNMSYECSKPRSRSVMRLDFNMDISTDFCTSVNSKTSGDIISQDIVGNSSVTKLLDMANQKTADNSKCISTIDFPENDVAPKKATFPPNDEKSPAVVINSKNHSCTDKAKLLIDFCKAYTNKSYVTQNADIQLDTSIHHSAFSSVQDTGYHTSTNCTTNIVGSCNNSCSEPRIYWSDQIAISENEIRLSDWNENMRNIFSSTPSRCSKESNE